MLRRSITDDRGQPIRLFGVRDDLPRLESREGVPRTITRRIDERLRRPRQIANWATAGVNTVACYYICVSLVPVLLKSGISAYVWAPSLLVANVVLSLGIALARRAIFHRYYTGEIVGAFLAERRCPACGYDLVGAKPGDDGFTVCPECGAAWNMPR